MNLIPGKLYKIKCYQALFYKVTTNEIKQFYDVVAIGVLLKDDVFMYIREQQGAIYILFQDKMGWCDILNSLDDLVAPI